MRISKIVFFSIPAHGHINPTLSVVSELVSRGHDVWYYSFLDFKEKIEGLGAKFIPCDEFLPLISHQELNRKVGKDFAALIEMIVDTTMALDEKVCTELRELQPDCIVSDSLCFWGKLLNSTLEISTGKGPLVLTVNKIFVKGKKIEGNKVEVLEIFPSKENNPREFEFYLTFKDSIHLTPWYGPEFKRNVTKFELKDAEIDSFKLYNYGESELSVIKTGKPETYSFVNTRLTGTGESIFIDGNFVPSSKGRDYFSINLSGTMDDLRAGNKTFFPNIVQWMDENFTAIVIAIMTVYITAKFTSVKQK